MKKRFLGLLLIVSGTMALSACSLLDGLSDLIPGTDGNNNKRFDVELAKKLHGMFSAKKEYISVYFDVVRNEYNNDYMEFFTRGLLLSEEQINAFRKKMIVEK